MIAYWVELSTALWGFSAFMRTCMSHVHAYVVHVTHFHSDGCDAASSADSIVRLLLFAACTKLTAGAAGSPQPNWRESASKLPRRRQPGTAAALRPPAVVGFSGSGAPHKPRLGRGSVCIGAAGWGGGGRGRGGGGGGRLGPAAASAAHARARAAAAAASGSSIASAVTAAALANLAYRAM